jgi:superfamily II DNA or RNA helicase
MCPNVSATSHNSSALVLRKVAVEAADALDFREFILSPRKVIKFVEDLDFSLSQVQQVFNSYKALSKLLCHFAFLAENKALVYRIQSNGLDNSGSISAKSAFEVASSLTNNKFLSLEFASYFRDPISKNEKSKFYEQLKAFSEEETCPPNLKARLILKYPHLFYEAEEISTSLNSLEYVDLPNWLSRLCKALKSGIAAQAISKQMEKQLTNEHIEIALRSARALNLEVEEILKFTENPVFLKKDKTLGRVSAKTLYPLISEACKKGAYSKELFEICMERARESGQVEHVMGFLQVDLPMGEQIPELLEFFKSINRNDLVVELLSFPSKTVDIKAFLPELLKASTITKLFPPILGHIQLEEDLSTYRDKVLIGLLNQEEVEAALVFLRRNYGAEVSPFELEHLKVDVRNLPSSTLYELNSIYKTTDSDYLEKIARFELNSLKTTAVADLILELLRASEDVRYFNAFFNLESMRYKLTLEDLQKYRVSCNSTIRPEVSTELGLKLYSTGDSLGAIAAVEDYASQIPDCAHIMFLCTGQAKWLESVLDLCDNNEIEELRLKFKSAGVAPATELEDPDLHRDLILGIKEPRTRKSRRPKDAIDENWICRKSWLKTFQSGISDCFHHGDAPFGARLLPTKESVLSAQLKSSYGEGDFAEFAALGAGWFLRRVREQKKSLYKWQEEAINSWTEHGRIGVVEAVTGSGKTMVALHAIAEAIDSNYAVLVVVPTRILGDQWMEKTLDIFNRMGKLERIGNVTTNFDVPVSHKAKPGVVTIAVLSGKLPPKIADWIESASDQTKTMLLVDEVHRISGKLYGTILHERFSRRLGLTATLMPADYDNSKLKNYFSGDAIYRYTFRDARRDNVISPYQLIMLGVELPIGQAQDYREAEFQLRSSRESILKMAGREVSVSEFPEFAEKLRQNAKYASLVEAYFRAQEQVDEIVSSGTKSSAVRALHLIGNFINRIGRTAIFSDFKINATNCDTALKAIGVDCRVITGETRPEDRENILQDLQFDESPLKVVIAPKVLDEGVDIENLTIGLFAGVQRHRRSLIQRLGRVLRRHPSKESAFVFVIYTVGSADDPNIENGKNRRLALSQFDFVGENANGEIESYVIGRDDLRLQERLQLI